MISESSHSVLWYVPATGADAYGAASPARVSTVYGELHLAIVHPFAAISGSSISDGSKSQPFGELFGCPNHGKGSTAGAASKFRSR
jgi:hypothetical protein